MGIGVALSSIPCILLPFAVLKHRGKMPALHWHVAALPGLLCGAGWELGFVAAVLSTMSPLGEMLLFGVKKWIAPQFDGIVCLACGHNTHVLFFGFCLYLCQDCL
jgi:hypothetical protein